MAMHGFGILVGSTIDVAIEIEVNRLVEEEI